MAGRRSRTHSFKAESVLGRSAGCTTQPQSQPSRSSIGTRRIPGLDIVGTGSPIHAGHPDHFAGWIPGSVRIAPVLRWSGAWRATFHDQSLPQTGGLGCRGLTALMELDTLWKHPSAVEPLEQSDPDLSLTLSGLPFEKLISRFALGPAPWCSSRVWTVRLLFLDHHLNTNTLRLYYLSNFTFIYPSFLIGDPNGPDLPGESRWRMLRRALRAKRFTFTECRNQTCNDQEHFDWLVDHDFFSADCKGGVRGDCEREGGCGPGAFDLGLIRLRQTPVPASESLSAECVPLKLGGRTGQPSTATATHIPLLPHGMPRCVEDRATS